MEILLWLVPAAVVTTLAMLWAAWAGRETTPSITPEEAAERLGRALRSDRPVRYSARPVPVRVAGGVAVRPAGPRQEAGSELEPRPELEPQPRPERRPEADVEPQPVTATVTQPPAYEPDRTRRAS